MSDHTVSVLRRNVDGFPQAVCGCNWEGPPRRGVVPLVRAILDAQWHSTQSLHMPANPLVIDPYRPGRSPFGPVNKWGMVDGSRPVQLDSWADSHRTWRRRLVPWLWAAAAAVGIIAVGLNAPAEQDWPAGNPDVTCQVTQ